MSRLTLLLAAALACTPGMASALPAPAQAPTAGKALVRFQRDLVNVLALRAEAQPLLGAALLARTLPDPPATITYHALLQRARKDPQAGPSVTWAQLVDCSPEAMDCPNAAALATLEKQAPDNAAVWLLALGQALRNGYRDDARADLAKAASATSYDDYSGTSLKALADAVTTLPPSEDTYTSPHAAATSAAGVRALLVFGVGSMQPLPGFQAAAQVCQQGKDDDTIRHQCLDLARTLAWGGTPLARSLGLHLRETLSTDDAVRRQSAQERRDLVWQVHNFGKLTLATQRDPDAARRLLTLARNGGTRMSLILAALRAAHIPVDAPADWKPHDADPSPPNRHGKQAK